MTRPLRPLLRRVREVAQPDESGQLTILILGYTVIAILLVMGTLAVTSAQLTRVRLLDAADAAALDAADALDTGVYGSGVGPAVPVSDATVTQTAAAYLAHRNPPQNVVQWGILPGTGSPDGQTAVVRLAGTVKLPFVGPLLKAFGSDVTITVESRARADLD